MCPSASLTRLDTRFGPVDVVARCRGVPALRVHGRDYQLPQQSPDSRSALAFGLADEAADWVLVGQGSGGGACPPPVTIPPPIHHRRMFRDQPGIRRLCPHDPRGSRAVFASGADICAPSFAGRMPPDLGGRASVPPTTGGDPDRRPDIPPLDPVAYTPRHPVPPPRSPAGRAAGGICQRSPSSDAALRAYLGRNAFCMTWVTLPRARCSDPDRGGQWRPARADPAGGLGVPDRLFSRGNATMYSAADHRAVRIPRMGPSYARPCWSRTAGGGRVSLPHMIDPRSFGQLVERTSVRIRLRGMQSLTSRRGGPPFSRPRRMANTLFRALGAADRARGLGVEGCDRLHLKGGADPRLVRGAG